MWEVWRACLGADVPRGKRNSSLPIQPQPIFLSGRMWEHLGTLSIPWESVLLSLQGSGGTLAVPGILIPASEERNPMPPPSRRPTYPSREPWTCLFLLQLLHNVSQGGLPGGGGRKAQWNWSAWLDKEPSPFTLKCQAPVYCSLLSQMLTLHTTGAQHTSAKWRTKHLPLEF